MSEDKTVIGFQLTEQELAELDRLAKRAERSRSAEMRLAMRAWLEQNSPALEDESPKVKAAHVAV